MIYRNTPVLLLALTLVPNPAYAGTLESDSAKTDGPSKLFTNRSNQTTATRTPSKQPQRVQAVSASNRTIESRLGFLPDDWGVQRQRGKRSQWAWSSDFGGRQSTIRRPGSYEDFDWHTPQLGKSLGLEPWHESFQFDHKTPGTKQLYRQIPSQSRGLALNWSPTKNDRFNPSLDSGRPSASIFGGRSSGGASKGRGDGGAEVGEFLRESHNFDARLIQSENPTLMDGFVSFIGGLDGFGWALLCIMVVGVFSLLNMKKRT